MTDPKTQLNDALKEAMKNKDNARRDVLRGLLSAIKQVEIDSRKDLTPEETLAVLQKEAKKRRESIDEAERVGRGDIAESEKYELTAIEAFLPRQLTYDEVKAIAQEIVTQVGATTAKDQGKVMGPLMGRLKGQADGKLVNQVVRELLNG